MLTGSMSLAFGSDATVMGMKVPGGYITLTGKEGVAGKIFENLMSNPLITGAVPMVPLKAEGWDSLYIVDQKIAPMPILFGVMKDTLFLGFIDSDALDKKPEVSPEVDKMLDNSLYGAGFIDTGEIWSRLRKEVADPNSLLSMAPGMEDAKGILNELLGADLSIPLIKLWSPELSTVLIEFSVVDVPDDKQLLPRLIKLGQMFKDK
jgi:hypothetical protein